MESAHYSLAKYISSIKTIPEDIITIGLTATYETKMSTEFFIRLLQQSSYRL
jgi:hypothetical protein